MSTGIRTHQGTLKRKEHMAVSFESKEDVTRGHSYWLATHDIDIDAENNGRHVLPDITCLVESIKANGQNTPCIIGKDGKRAKLFDGHSRWRAICEINKTRKPEDRLKVWCVYSEGNEIDGLISGFAANRERNSLTPVDEGYFVARMQKYGKTMEDIAKLCHEDEKWCKQRLALVSLTPEAQERVSDGTVKLTAAVALAKLAADEQRRYLKSGKKLTASGIKHSGDEATGKTPKKIKPSLKKLYDLLRDMAGKDKYPDGLSKTSTKDQLCEWLMSFIQGD